MSVKVNWILPFGFLSLFSGDFIEKPFLFHCIYSAEPMNSTGEWGTVTAMKNNRIKIVMQTCANRK